MDIKLAEGSQPFAPSPYKIPDILKMGFKQEIEASKRAMPKGHHS